MLWLSAETPSAVDLSGCEAAAPDLRAGAAFHLARLAADAGATELACKWAHRCLALVPCHEAATALLRQPELRKAS